MLAGGARRGLLRYGLQDALRGAWLSVSEQKSLGRTEKALGTMCLFISRNVRVLRHVQGVSTCRTIGGLLLLPVCLGMVSHVKSSFAMRFLDGATIWRIADLAALVVV